MLREHIKTCNLVIKNIDKILQTIDTTEAAKIRMQINKLRFSTKCVEYFEIKEHL